MRRRRSLGGAFSPRKLFTSGVAGAWYDPSDFSTLFQDNAGTTPVTATGQSVGRILDKSGNANHATQATAASKPTLQQTAGGLYYLSFDGSNDSMSTSSINFSSTDKMSVCTGVTKSSDAAQAILYELSVDTFSNNGSFLLWAPGAAAGANYYARVRGSLLSNAITFATYAAPITNVATMLADISGDSVNIRVNGASAVTSTSDLGTGNFGNYPLFIGRRNNASLPFNGRIYQMVVCGKALSASDLAAVERFVNSKTGAY
jgi:hypothetical protein